MNEADQGGIERGTTAGSPGPASPPERERLAEIARLALAGEIAGGIAHDLSNPLSSILGFTQAILLEQPAGPLRDDLATIEREAQRCTALTRSLAGYLQRTAAPGRPVAAVELVERMAGLLGFLARRRQVSVTARCSGEGSPTVRSSRELEYVILALLHNAIRAQDAGGAVTVTLTALEGGGTRMEVADRGPGIPPDQLERVFQPHHSTWGSPGLGLPVSRFLVQQAGGTMSLRSVLGEGTTATVNLPAPPAEDAGPPANG